MTAVYRKRYPIQLPDGAQIITRRGKRLARWRSGRLPRHTPLMDIDWRNLLRTSNLDAAAVAALPAFRSSLVRRAHLVRLCTAKPPHVSTLPNVWRQPSR